VLQALRIGHDNSGLGPSWHLQVGCCSTVGEAVELCRLAAWVKPCRAAAHFNTLEHTGHCLGPGLRPGLFSPSEKHSMSDEAMTTQGSSWHPQVCCHSVTPTTMHRVYEGRVRPRLLLGCALCSIYTLCVGVTPFNDLG
jgi:hypothetical protein